MWGEFKVVCMIVHVIPGHVDLYIVSMNRTFVGVVIQLHRVYGCTHLQDGHQYSIIWYLRDFSF